MKEIKLKFYGLGIGNNYQADIKIYDNYGNLVYDGQTYNGCLIICLEECKRYKLIANSCGDIINVCFYVYNNDIYNFFFNRSYINRNSNSITLILTDYYYKNLPIEEGELILWQR